MWLSHEQPNGSVGPPLTEGFLFSDSVIDRDTIQAYLETHYHVHGDTPMTLKVGEANCALAALHKQCNVTSSAFLTACNPFSQSFDDPTNAIRQDSLAQALRLRALPCIDGMGKHPSNPWPGEASFLVPGLPLEAAEAIGIAFGQNAIIWCGADAVPQLVLLR